MTDFETRSVEAMPDKRAIIPSISCDPPGTRFFDLASKREMKLVLEGDFANWIVVRHPDLPFTQEMADRFCSDLRVVAS